MHAIQLSRYGGPEVLQYTELPTPVPGPRQVLVRTEAIGVNFIDTYFRTGAYPHALPFVPGCEVSGIVTEAGCDVTEFEVGDRVATADTDGTYAEYCVANVDLTTRVPDGISPQVAASALLKGETAHLLINSVYPVEPGDAILVHAGAGGVGLILTQWATSKGARVITTVSTPQKAELSRQAGAADVVGYPDDPAEFGDMIRNLTDGEGVAAVYDGVGRSTFDASLASLAIRGTLALFGAASGPVPPVDPQRLNAAGSVYLTRPYRTHFNRTAAEFSWRAGELFDAITSGAITITVGATYSLNDAAQAHRDLEARHTQGSTILIPDRTTR
ncbi:quinone oxidoreductase [Mycolicibacterium cosmeticum]|uniref:quinone oxidoreductase family protein n=1 Tax=Mycolicibacterium cosmeticum TaxID=258533 RepID=UPI00320491B7